jgi:dCMP deaminase
MADITVENTGYKDELIARLRHIFSEQPLRRPSWDEYFMKMAALVGERSTCLRHHIGAVIVKDKRVLTTGYNGAVSGAEDCSIVGCRKDELNLSSGFASEECRAVHAEQNAIIQAANHGLSIKGAVMYLTTRPCRMCAKELVNAGIKEVITYSHYAGAKGSVEFLEKNGVKIRNIDRPNPIISFKD